MDNVRWNRREMVDWIDWDEFEAEARELQPSRAQDRRDTRDPNAVGNILLSCMEAWGRPMNLTASQTADALSASTSALVQ